MPSDKNVFILSQNASCRKCIAIQFHIGIGIGTPTTNNGRIQKNKINEYIVEIGTRPTQIYEACARASVRHIREPKKPLQFCTLNVRGDLEAVFLSAANSQPKKWYRTRELMCISWNCCANRNWKANLSAARFFHCVWNKRTQSLTDSHS